MKKLSYFICAMVVMIVHIVLMIVYRKFKKNKIKKYVKEVLDNNTDINPCINVNTAPLYILEELPYFITPQVKKIIWIRRHNGRYVSVEDFFEKLEVAQENRSVLEKIICC